MVRMLVTSVLLWGTLSLSVRGFAQDVVMPEAILQNIASALQEPLYRIPVDPVGMEAARERIRTWVSRSMDLKQAEKAHQRRFKRTTYRQAVTSEALRLPTERLGPLRQPLGRRDVGQPIPIIYREGQQYFQFEKITEVMGKGRLPDAAAIGESKRFLLENEFVIETGEDRVSRGYVRAHRLNEEVKGGPARDVLVRQDVVFEREYQGKPVINSAVIIGYHPDNSDIVFLKHLSWAPAKGSDAKRVQPNVSGGGGGVASVAAVRKRLEEKMRAGVGRFTHAEVTHVSGLRGITFTSTWALV